MFWELIALISGAMNNELGVQIGGHPLNESFHKMILNDGFP